MKIRTKIDTSGIKHLHQRSKELNPSVEASVRRSMQKVFDESQLLVPINTGALKESGRIIDQTNANGDPEVAIVYGNDMVDYALSVHEDLTMFHAVGQAKYLEVPFERERPDIIKSLKQRIKEVFRDFQ